MFRKVRKLVVVLAAAAMALPHAASAYAEAGTARCASTYEEYIDATDAADDADPVFGAKRIKIKALTDSDEGAQKAVSYNGQTLLSYRTAAQTKRAYERLSEKYGAANVIVDLPVMQVDSVGWGVEYMNLDDQIRREHAVHGANAGKVTVAVIDSGVDLSHEIFSGRTVTASSKDFLDPEGSIADQNGHGTEVAGIICEAVPDNVELMILKVFVDGERISTETVSQAVRYAADNGADVINLSMSTSYSESLSNYPEIAQSALQDMEEALGYAAEKGIIICAASGNNGEDMDALYSYPAKSAYTISVGSVNKSGERSWFSNYGASLDFCAPGDEVIVAVADSDSKYTWDSGTSLATPCLSACCACLKTDDPSADIDSAREAFKKIAVDYGETGRDDYFGWGMPKWEDYKEMQPSPEQPQVKKVRTITLNTVTVSAASVTRAVKKAHGASKYVYKIVLGKKVRKIRAGAFKKCRKASVLDIRSRKLTGKSVRGSLKKSAVKTVRVRVGKSAVNRKYIRKYKKFFTRKNTGRKVSVR